MRLRLTMVLAGLLLAGGCRNHDNDTPKDTMNTAGEQARKAGETVRSQRRDYDKTREDLAARDRQLSGTEEQLADARARYTVAGRERLAKIDAELNELRVKADYHARTAYADLKIQRDRLAARLDQAGAMATDAWDGFKKDVDDGFDKLEKDVNDALH